MPVDAPSTRLAASAAPSLRPNGTERAATAGLLITTLIVFLLSAWPLITAPFGDSHDGRNGATWARGSEQLREVGPLGSKFGAELDPVTGEVYANHPPLIYTETAMAELLAGERPWVTRAPAWIGSIAVAVLLVALLGELGVGRLAAAVGVGMVVGTPMFLVYGTMLDTPVTSLPFGLLVVLVWLRSRRRPATPTTLVGVAALAGLAGWESLLLVGLLCAWELVSGLRNGDRSRTRTAGYLGSGALGALAGVLGWQIWVHGSLDELVEQLRFRTGAGDLGVGLLGALDHQATWLRLLFPGITLLVGIPLLVLAMVDRRTRQVARLLVATVLAYTVLLHGGAYFHDYWNYWLLTPLAIAFAVGTDRALPVLRRRYGPALTAVGVALLVGAFVVSAAISPSAAGWWNEAGRPAGQLAAAGPTGDGPALPYLGQIVEGARWIGYAQGQSRLALSDRSTLARLAEDRPTQPVLVASDRLPDWFMGEAEGLADRALAGEGPWLLVAAADVAELAG